MCFYFGVDTASHVIIAQTIEWIELALVLWMCLLFLQENNDDFVRVRIDKENEYEITFSHSVCLGINNMKHKIWWAIDPIVHTFSQSLFFLLTKTIKTFWEMQETIGNKYMNCTSK